MALCHHCMFHVYDKEDFYIFGKCCVNTQSPFGSTIDDLTNKMLLPRVYPKNYAHGFVVLCFVVVMQSFIMNSHEVYIHIHQGCFAGTGAIVRLPQCHWSKPDGYGKTSQCITTTKHSKAKTVCIFLGIYCNTRYTVTGKIEKWCYCRYVMSSQPPIMFITNR